MKNEPILEYGELSGPGELRLVRLLPGPIERVWTYLTDSAQRGLWLAAGPMEVRVGGKVELTFHHADLTPHRETVPEKYQDGCSGGHVTSGRVTRCEPPRLLSYTWIESECPDSEVTFELATRRDKVLLVLTHRRLGEDREVLTGVSAGWHTHMTILAARLEGTVPPPFWATFVRLESDYEKRLPVGA